MMPHSYPYHLFFDNVRSCPSSEYKYICDHYIQANINRYNSHTKCHSAKTSVKLSQKQTEVSRYRGAESKKRGGAVRRMGVQKVKKKGVRRVKGGCKKQSVRTGGPKAQPRAWRHPARCCWHALSATRTRLARSLKQMSALSATVLAKRVFRLAPLSGSGLARSSSLPFFC